MVIIVQTNRHTTNQFALPGQLVSVNINAYVYVIDIFNTERHSPTFPSVAATLQAKTPSIAHSPVPEGGSSNWHRRSMDAESTAFDCCNTQLTLKVSHKFTQIQSSHKYIAYHCYY